MEQDSVTLRIKYLVAKYADKPADFAKATGLTNQNVYDLTSGRKGGPSLASIKKLLIAFPDVSERWLLLGEGRMLKSDEAPKNNFVYEAQEPVIVQGEPAQPYTRAYSNSQLQVLTVQVGPDNDENIEFVSTRAAAGYARHGRIEREYIQHLPSFRLPDPAYRNGSFRCFQVSGDSMQPTFSDGDWLICRFVEDWARDIADNRVYVIVSEESVLAKRVLNHFNERGQITLQSDNRAYGVQFMDGQDVREVWVGVGRLTRQLMNPRFDVPDELARLRADIEEIMLRVEVLETR